MTTEEEIYNLALNAEDIRVSAAPHININPRQYSALLDIAIQKFGKLITIIDEQDSGAHGDYLTSSRNWALAHLGASRRARGVTQRRPADAMELFEEAKSNLLESLGATPSKPPVREAGNPWQFAQLGHVYQWQAITSWNATDSSKQHVRDLFQKAIDAYRVACDLCPGNDGDTDTNAYTYMQLPKSENDPTGLEGVTYATALAHLGMAHRGLSMTYPVKPDLKEIDEIIENLVASYRCFFVTLMLNSNYAWSRFFIARISFLIGDSCANMAQEHEMLGKQAEALSSYKAAVSSFQLSNTYLDQGLGQDFAITGSKDVWKYFADETTVDNRRDSIWAIYLILSFSNEDHPFDPKDKKTGAYYDKYLQIFRSVFKNISGPLSILMKNFSKLSEVDQ